MTLAPNPTLRSGSKSVDFDRIETRGVLAGAYRGRRRSPEQELTHLVFIGAGDSFGFATGCRQPIDNMVDPYGHTAAQKRERPTCPTCAAKYDRIVREFGSTILGMETNMPRRHRRNSEELDQHESELFDEIMDEEYEEWQLEQLQKSLESFTYTSTLLAALASIYIDEYQDPDGNLLLLEFSERFAKHEAKTL